MFPQEIVSHKFLTTECAAVSDIFKISNYNMYSNELTSRENRFRSEQV